MDELTLINESRNLLNKANAAETLKNHEEYATHMSSLLELLAKELIGDAPAEPEAPKQDGDS